VYVYGDPVNMSDLSGKAGCPWWKRALNHVGRNWDTYLGIGLSLTGVGLGLGGVVLSARAAGALYLGGFAVGLGGAYRACTSGRESDCKLAAAGLVVSGGATGVGLRATGAIDTAYVAGALLEGGSIGAGTTAVILDVHSSNKRSC